MKTISEWPLLTLGITTWIIDSKDRAPEEYLRCKCTMLLHIKWNRIYTQIASYSHISRFAKFINWAFLAKLATVSRMLSMRALSSFPTFNFNTDQLAALAAKKTNGRMDKPRKRSVHLVLENHMQTHSFDDHWYSCNLRSSTLDVIFLCIWKARGFKQTWRFCYYWFAFTLYLSNLGRSTQTGD